MPHFRMNLKIDDDMVFGQAQLVDVPYDWVLFVHNNATSAIKVVQLKYNACFMEALQDFLKYIRTHNAFSDENEVNAVDSVDVLEYCRVQLAFGDDVYNMTPVAQWTGENYRPR